MVLNSYKTGVFVSAPLLHFCAKNILVSWFASRNIHGNRDDFVSEGNLQIVHVQVSSPSLMELLFCVKFTCVIKKIQS